MNSIPKVSYLLLSFNQSSYIEDAVKSALNQNYENIEFIFSDDCSSDDTWEKIQLLARDSKRPVTLNRMSTNQGLVKHLNFCLSICSGDLIVLHAGDDIALLDRVSKSVECLKEYPDAYWVKFNDQTIDSKGNIISDKRPLSNSGFFDLNTAFELQDVFFSGASTAIRRNVYDVFGPLQQDCTTEDSPLLLRALYLGGIILSNDEAILYRKTETSLSSKAGMKTHDFEAIDRQYKKDFYVAIKQGLLSSNQQKIALSWMAFMKIKKEFSQTKDLCKKIMILSINFIKNKHLRKYIVHKVIG